MAVTRMEAHQSSDHYKQMWMHERNRRMEVEQENIRLRKIVYNTKFSINERAIALEIAEQVKEARHVDEQGRKLFSQKDAAEKLGLSRGTISNAVDILAESGFVKDKETSALRDKDGKLVKGKDGRIIKTIHLDIEQDLYEDFSQVERADPRKIKDDRKPYTWQCQKCLSVDVTIETTRHLVCRNPNCSACGEKVLIDVDYKDQNSEHTSEEIPDVQNLCIIETEDNDVQNLCIKDEDVPYNPPPSVPAAADRVSSIKEYLAKHRGTRSYIYATEKLTSEFKYLPKQNVVIGEDGKPVLDKSGKVVKVDDENPDIDAFIRGDIDHIYGSKLINPETGKTWFLCFDLDHHHPEKNTDPCWLEQAQNWLIDFAREGAAAIYWQRGTGGHFVIGFSEPVYPERARLWAYSICPDLEDITECYPCQSVQNKNLSWPMWRRRGNVVESTIAYYMLPEPHDGALQECDPTNHEDLAAMITDAVTPAGLVEEFSKRADELAEDPKREKASTNVQGGLHGKPKPTTNVNEADLTKQVIADFIGQHPWDWVANECGGYGKGRKFKAVWRGDATVTVRADADGNLACDYGDYGMFPKKFDPYDAYCMIQAKENWQAFRRADLAERCAEYRRQQSQDPSAIKSQLTQIVEPIEVAAIVATEIPTELFPEESAPELFTPNYEQQFWAIGRRLGYPALADLGLGMGMTEWNGFIFGHRPMLPDVIARLGAQ